MPEPTSNQQDSAKDINEAVDSSRSSDAARESAQLKRRTQQQAGEQGAGQPAATELDKQNAPAATSGPQDSEGASRKPFELGRSRPIEREGLQEEQYGKLLSSTPGPAAPKQGAGPGATKAEEGSGEENKK